MAMITLRDDAWGRAVVARHALGAGDVVLREAPLAVATRNIVLVDDARTALRAAGTNSLPEYRTLIARCARPSCFAPTDSAAGRLCAGCNWALYCSEACERADAPVHGRICDRELLMSPVALAARVLAQGLRLPFWLYRTPRLHARALRAAARLLAPRFPALPSGDVLRTCVACADAAFSMRSTVGARVYAEALYVRASYLNHACDPNAYLYHDGAELVVRVSRPIAAGEQVFVSYVDAVALSGPAARAADLAERLSTRTCACARCVDPGRVALDLATLSRPADGALLDGGDVRALHELALSSTAMGYAALDMDGALRLAERSPRLFGALHAATLYAYRTALCSSFELGRRPPGVADVALRLRASLGELCARGVVGDVTALLAWCDITEFLLARPTWLSEPDPPADGPERERRDTLIHWFLALGERARHAIESRLCWDVLWLERRMHPACEASVSFLEHELRALLANMDGRGTFVRDALDPVSSTARDHHADATRNSDHHADAKAPRNSDHDHTSRYGATSPPRSSDTTRRHHDGGRRDSLATDGTTCAAAAASDDGAVPSVATVRPTKAARRRLRAAAKGIAAGQVAADDAAVAAAVALAARKSVVV